MTHRIPRRFITAVATASIIVTGFSAVPARANEDEIGGLLAALLGLAVLGVVANKVLDDAEVKHPHRSRPVKRQLLPQECLRSIHVKDGRMRVFGRRCLKANHIRVSQLPGHCKRRFPTARGTRKGFAARCLRRNGYQLARY